MKHFRRILSLVLAAALVAGLGAVSVLADTKLVFKFDLDGYDFSIASRAGNDPEAFEDQLTAALVNSHYYSKSVASDLAKSEEWLLAEQFTTLRQDSFSDMRFDNRSEIEDAGLELAASTSNAGLCIDAEQVMFETLELYKNPEDRSAIMDMARGLGSGTNHEDGALSLAFFEQAASRLPALDSELKVFWGKLVAMAVHYSSKQINSAGTDEATLFAACDTLLADAVKLQPELYDSFLVMSIGTMYAVRSYYENTEDIWPAYKTMLGWLRAVPVNARMPLAMMSAEVLLSVANQPVEAKDILALTEDVVKAMTFGSEDYCLALANFGALAADSISRQPQAKDTISQMLNSSVLPALRLYANCPDAQLAIGKLYGVAALGIARQPEMKTQLQNACAGVVSDMAGSTADVQTALGDIGCALVVLGAKIPDIMRDGNAGRIYDTLAAQCKNGRVGAAAVAQMGSQLLTTLVKKPGLYQTLASYEKTAFAAMLTENSAVQTGMGATVARLFSKIASNETPATEGDAFGMSYRILDSLNGRDAEALSVIGAAMVDATYGVTLQPTEDFTYLFRAEQDVLGYVARYGTRAAEYGKYMLKNFTEDAIGFTDTGYTLLSGVAKQINQALEGETGDRRESVFDIGTGYMSMAESAEVIAALSSAFTYILQAMDRADASCDGCFGTIGRYYMYANSYIKSRDMDRLLVSMPLNYFAAQKLSWHLADDNSVTVRCSAGMEYLVSKLERNKLEEDWSVYGDMRYVATTSCNHTFEITDLDDGYTLYYRCRLGFYDKPIDEELELAKKTASVSSFPVYQIKLVKENETAYPHDITVTPCVNGSVTADAVKAPSGNIVTLTVAPAAGYTVDTLTVADKENNALPVSHSGNVYTFTMPNSAVSVSCTFKKTVGAAVFADVTVNEYCYYPVLWAFNKGITSGTDATHFSPNAATTRAQMVTLLWRAAGAPVVEQTVSFTDVDTEAYYADAVRWAVAEGITTGVDEAHFNPGGIVTRAQAVTFLYRLAKGSAANSVIFADVAESDYFCAAVAWAVSHSITDGTGEGRFSPASACTRGQIVTFLYRYFA